MKFTAPLLAVFLGAPIAAMAGGPATPTIEPVVAAPVALPVIVPHGDWTGGYIGLSLGSGNSYGSTPGNGNTLGVGGAHIGYRYETGRFVVGGELSYNKDDIGRKSKATGTTVNNTSALDLIVGGDLGRTLVYGTLGVSRAQATVAGVSASDTGYGLGIGLDYAVNEKFTVGGQIKTNRYHNFNGSSSDLKDTMVLLKVGLKF